MSMLAVITNWLFSPGGLTAHGFCLLWEPWLIWTHAGADALVGLAYFTIPVALLRYARRRSVAVFGPALWLFAGFILLCGSGHWLDLLTLWIPVYRLEGVVKAATALVSIITAVVVWKLVPVALTLPTPAQLEAAHEALRESEVQILAMSKIKDQFQDMVEASPTALILAGDDGTIRMVNAQAESIFGYDRAELQGQNVEVLVPPNLRRRHADLRADFQASKSPWPMGEGRALLGLRKDHTSFPIEVGLSPIEIGGVSGVLAGITDTTARHAAERAVQARQEELEQSNAALIRAKVRAERTTRAKSSFLAGMSHELRTPLNGILGYAELLGIEGELNAVQQSRVGAMQAAGRHLLEMINSVLDLSKIEAGEVTVSEEAAEARKLLNDCLEIVRPAAAKKNLAIGVDVAADVPERIVVDAARLSQILINLVGNAIKFTDSGAVNVRVRASCAPGETVYLRIEIADTGRGISADRRANLFQEFDRLDAEANIEGAGLGLAISAKLATLMGGCLAHEDNAGGGSVFVLTLPLSGCATSPASVSGEPAIYSLDEADTPATSLRILVVDDVAMNRDIASAFLREAGHHVTCAEGGGEAVEIAARAAWDVVLMDLRMPDIDGFEATRRIRALGGVNGRVPIVALTAHAFKEQITACSGAGMVGHLAKPFTQASLLSAVTSAMRASTAEAGAPPAGSEEAARLPVFDINVFETSASFLTPTKIASYLEFIVDGAQSLQQALGVRDVTKVIDAEILDTAHKVAGAVGMFGFARLASLARQFERDARAGAAPAPVMTQSLHDALEASLREARQRQFVLQRDVAAAGPD